MRLRPRSLPNFPDLPHGCPPLTPTVGPDDATAVRNNLDKLSGLTPDRFNQLSRLTADPDPDVVAQLAGDSPVLGLADLLRQRRDGTLVLHPHVIQVVPFGVADTLLQSVNALLEFDSDFVRYQYPRFLLECHGITPDRVALYPPEYHIHTLDVLTDLRANNIVTSVRRPDQDFTDADTVRDAVETAQANGTMVHGSLTLHQEDDEMKPTLSVNAAHELTAEPPTDDQLVAQCRSLCKRLYAPLDLISSLPSDEHIAK